MDTFLTFLSNYYIWFLVAAGIFLFALIGLVIESSKKRKKEEENGENEEVGTVESFRSGDLQEDSTSNEVNVEANPESSPSVNNEAASIDLGATPSLEDNGRTFEMPSVENDNESKVQSDTPVYDASSISFETPSFDGPVESAQEQVPEPVNTDFETEETNNTDVINNEVETNNEISFETPSIDENTDTVSTVEEIPEPETPSFEIVDDVLDTDSVDNQTETDIQDDMMSIPSLDNVPAFENVDVEQNVE